MLHSEILQDLKEGQTPLDEEEKIELIPSLITRQDLNEFEQENILQARQWAIQKLTLTKWNIFSEKFILELHKRMYQYVWKWAGKYRKSNKNIGCEFYLITTELRNLLDDIKYWLEHKIYNIKDIAVICHHRLVKIHLFPNGNGRHARLYADVITIKYGIAKLTWGGSISITKANKIRKQYIAALREADRGNYNPLLTFARS